MIIKRNVLLNPGPATTTDTVKMAQVVPDICPREKEFAGMMKQLRTDLLRMIAWQTEEYDDEEYDEVYDDEAGEYYEDEYSGDDSYDD